MSKVNYVTIEKEEFRDVFVEAMCDARRAITNLDTDKEDMADIILMVGHLGALIGAFLIPRLFGKGETE